MPARKKKSYVHRRRNKSARFKAKHQSRARRLIRQHNK